MRGAYKILTVRGIGIHIHWTFLLLILWLLLVNRVVGGDIEQFAWLTLFVLVIFVCVTLHELGHSMVALRYNIQVRSIVLLPIGGLANMERLPDRPGQELAVSIAGPVVNVLIAAAIYPFLTQDRSMWNLEGNMALVDERNFLFNLYLVNIWLALFNMIPAFPMDGGRILRAILAMRLNYARATSIAAATGKVIAGIFILGGFFLFNLFLPLIGLFIIFAANAEEYFVSLRSMMKDLKVKDVLTNDYKTLPAETTVEEAAGVLMESPCNYFVVMRDSRPDGTLSRMEIMKEVAAMNYRTAVRDLIRGELQLLDGQKEVRDVLHKLAGARGRTYAVMENNRFAGLVNLQHIIEYMLVHDTTTDRNERMRSLAGLR